MFTLSIGASSSIFLAHRLLFIMWPFNTSKIAMDKRTYLAFFDCSIGLKALIVKPNGAGWCLEGLELWEITHGKIQPIIDDLYVNV